MLRGKFATLLLVIFSAPPLHSHDSLFEWLELRISETGEAVIEITIHAPSLIDDGSIDPTSSDYGWYGELGKEDRAALARSAVNWVESAFRIHSGKGLISFPDIALPPTLDQAARPGSFVATAKLPTLEEKLQIDYLASEKRLMLVVVRPRSFPKTLDIAPGETFAIDLSAP